MLEFLSTRFSYQSREQWNKEIEAQRIERNGNQVRNCHELLAIGDQLVYLCPEWNEPGVDLSFSVLYEDNDILVVDKPGNLPCHPGGRYFNHTLWALLKQQYGTAALSFVNRLDRETSGVVLIAKNRIAARICNRQFVENTVYKRYYVLVEGDFPDKKITACGFLSADELCPVRKKMSFRMKDEGRALPDNAKQCSTTFRLSQRCNGTSLLEAIPSTGRMHQIRATLCSLGYPVVGDKLYGIDHMLFLRFIQGELTPGDYMRLRMKRQALHAQALGIVHPCTGKEMEFSSPVPQEFIHVLAKTP